MREYYLEGKMDGLNNKMVLHDHALTILRLERQNRTARIMNDLHAYVEKETRRFKHELISHIHEVLDKEL